MNLKKGKEGFLPDAYFLDTSILMYAAGSSHPLREPCRDALSRAVSHRATLVTNSEVLQEIIYRCFSIGKAEIARVVYQSAVGLCAEILPVGEEHTERALELLSKYPEISPRDAIHIATMETAGITQILSTDKDFDDLKEIRRIDPAQFLT
jgi:uncharacterized protein